MRRELLAQATFYFTAPADVRRLANIRNAKAVPGTIADVRALVKLIRPRRKIILDPQFQPEWLDDALELAAVVEKARAARAASVAVDQPRLKQMRQMRDRIVARVERLQSEIRMYGRHAFRDDPRLWAAFGSAYLRNKRKRQKKRGGGDGT